MICAAAQTIQALSNNERLFLSWKLALMANIIRLLSFQDFIVVGTAVKHINFSSWSQKYTTVVKTRI
jgi:hypothetical protein